MCSSAVRTQVFHIDEFKDPRLPGERRALLESEESETLDMSVQSVLRAARECTGLSDFGADDFQERLGKLLAEVEADNNVWKSAKRNFFNVCVKAASNRLKNCAFVKKHPEINDIQIDRPIFITGLPRSGTTHLENLIAADRRLRYLPVYLGSEAVPNPGEKPGPGGQDPRWLRADEHWSRIKTNPIMAAMHEHSPDHACGENELQLPDFASYQWEWLADVPQWRNFYYSQDQTPHYEYGRTILKAIAFQFPSERRWILKGNAQSEQLPVLTRVYPDATIVMTHRDPVAILQSVLTMRGLAVLAHQKVPNIQAHVTYWVDRIEHMLRAYIRDMDCIPAERRIDLMFQDVMADDIGSAQKVLVKAGLPPTEESERDMAQYMAEHPRGRDGRVVYDLEGNFGLDVNVLRDRFRFYTDYFPVRLEVV